MEPINQLCNLRSRSQFKVMGFFLEFCVRSITPEPFERFSLNFGQMFKSLKQCAEPMTQLSETLRSQFKVMDFTPQFRVRSISLEPFE